MPHAAAAAQSLRDAGYQTGEALAAAVQFVPRERGEATIRKWLSRQNVEEMPEGRMVAMAADAMLLSADLLVSQPSVSGTTAFDRLARSRPSAPPAEKAAIGLLCKSRFRLLRLEKDAQIRGAMACDVVSNEKLCVISPELPPMAAGTMLFGRVVTLGDGLCCWPGAITPLDPSGFAVARAHPKAGALGAAASARWAEAVYGHVVRHGTLDVPGLNRPADYFDAEDGPHEAEEDALFALAMAWAELADGTQDEALLQRTRQLADLPGIVDALAAAVLARDARHEAAARGFERLLLVQMERILRRERGGSGGVTLDRVGHTLDEAIAAHRLPPEARKLFATLRHRLKGGSSALRSGDPALERLVQRIQGLRAKTVAQGCTEQEALAAAEKVAELLDRHGLSLGELDFRAQPCDGVGIQTDRRRFAPIDSCIPDIASFFDCRVWVERAKGRALRYVFFGLRGDVTAAQYLHELVERAFETETNAFRAGSLYAEMAGERRSATNSFQIGLSRGIAGKLRAMQAARAASRRSASGRDLVPLKAAMVNEELAKLGLDLHACEMGQRKRVLTDAFAAGEAAGQRFEFSPAITEAA